MRCGVLRHHVQPHLCQGAGWRKAGVGVRHGRERRAEDRQGHRLPVPYAGASAARLHRLQPRRGAGGHPPCPVPPHLQIRHGAVHPLGAERLGHRAQGQRRGDCCRRYRRAGLVY